MQNITLLDPQFHTRPTRLSRGFSALTSTITPSLLSPSLVRSSQVFFRSLKKQPRRVYIALTSSSGARETLHSSEGRRDGWNKKEERKNSFSVCFDVSLSFLLSGVLQHRIYAISMRVAFKGATAARPSGWELELRVGMLPRPTIPASPTSYRPLFLRKKPFSPDSALWPARIGRNVEEEEEERPRDIWRPQPRY